MSPNPHYKNSDRPAYELPYLLGDLSRGSFAGPLSEDQVFLADAAQSHAYNANEALMRGIESLGHLLFIASGSEGGLSSRHLGNLGELIQHLAVDAQHLQDTEANTQAILNQHQQHAPTRPAGKGFKG